MNSKIWSKAKANDWYANMPWMRGCNYMPPECANRIDMWQSLNFERNLQSMELDFALMQTIGFNSIRVILEFIVWDQEHDTFMANFERFLALAAKYDIMVMVCFANDCDRLRYNYPPKKLGPQTYDIGYHGGKKPLEENLSGFPFRYYPELDDPETAERFYAMVREIISRYAADPRICVWDLYNEPGIYGFDNSLPHVERIFEEARKVETIQPVTACIWWNIVDQTQVRALELSDVVSYHSYRDYESNIDEIAELRQYGRPLLLTEWLDRNHGNTIQQLFPIFYLEKISCWNWGFTAGAYQTYEPGNYRFTMIKLGERCTDGFDYTKWMHDLFRAGTRHPYDPNEIAIIMKYCKMADSKEPLRKYSGLTEQ